MAAAEAGGGGATGLGGVTFNSNTSRQQHAATAQHRDREMLSLARDLLKKSHDSDIKPLTVCFWTDFMANPSIMYGLFSPTPRKLNWDSDKVKVMGTKDGMINQININSVEDLDCFHEEILGVPLLLRVWAEHVVQNDMASGNTTQWEGDLALLVDTSHPMIRPELERALEQARKILQSQSLFCVQVDFGPAIDQWLKIAYPRAFCTLGSVKNHKALLFITNYDKPNRTFDCSPIWWLLLSPCWLLSAPCYKLFRKLKCNDIKIYPDIAVVRRTILPNGKIVEVTRC